MLFTEADVATTALVVSLIALLVASGQLTQQIFGTAEGYRRCQESVVGPWAHFKHRRFRFSELRMETQFMTPKIFLSELTDLKSTHKASDPAVVSSGWWRWYQWSRFELKSVGRDLRPGEVLRVDQAHGLIPKSDSSHSGAQAGWLSLLSRLQTLEQGYHTMRDQSVSLVTSPRTPHGTVSMKRLHPVFQPLPISWDLMPPDVVRPLATTTLGDIIIIAHRLGMEWKEIRPSKVSCMLKALWSQPYLD